MRVKKALKGWLHLFRIASSGGTTPSPDGSFLEEYCYAVRLPGEGAPLSNRGALTFFCMNKLQVKFNRNRPPGGALRGFRQSHTPFFV